MVSSPRRPWHLQAPRKTLPVIALVVIAFVALVTPSVIAQVGGLPGTGSGDGSGTSPPPVQDPGRDLVGGLDGTSFSTGILAGVAVTAVLGLLAGMFFMGGTKFVTAENVLDNDARRTIFEHILENPGCHLRATATALDLSTTNVLWHMRKLEAANLVNSRKFEGYKVFYPVAGGVESRKKAMANSVLRNDNARQILDYISGNPSAHQREIARAIGVNHGTIRWHLRKMNDAGLVLQVKKEHTSQYYVSELGVQFLSPEKAREFASQPDFEVPSPEELRPAEAASSGIVRRE